MADLVAFEAVFPARLVRVGTVAFEDAPGDVHWVTINGAHIPIGADGKPAGQGVGKTLRSGFRHGTDEDHKRIGIGRTFIRSEVAQDPKSDIQAIAYRADGTNKYYYSSEHEARQRAAKFERQKAFHEALPGLLSKIHGDCSEAGRQARDSAQELHRPGCVSGLGVRGQMTVEELERESRNPEVQHPTSEELQKAADQHFSSVEFVNPPKPQLKVEAEAEERE